MTVIAALGSCSMVAVALAGLPALSTVSAVRVSVPGARLLRSSVVDQVPSPCTWVTKVSCPPWVSVTVRFTSSPASTLLTVPDSTVASSSASLRIPVLPSNTCASSKRAVMVASVSLSKVKVWVASLPAMSVPVSVMVSSPSARAVRSTPSRAQLFTPSRLWSPLTVTVVVTLLPLWSVISTSSTRPPSMPVTVPDRSTPAAISAAFSTPSSSAGLARSALMLATGS